MLGLDRGYETQRKAGLVRAGDRIGRGLWTPAIAL